jgi:hypothetical protein
LVYPDPNLKQIEMPNFKAEGAGVCQRPANKGTFVPLEQHTFKNTKITFYVETTGAENFILYLYVVHYFTPFVN